MSSPHLHHFLPIFLGSRHDHDSETRYGCSATHPSPETFHYRCNSSLPFLHGALLEPTLPLFCLQLHSLYQAPVSESPPCQDQLPHCHGCIGEQILDSHWYCPLCQSHSKPPWEQFERAWLSKVMLTTRLIIVDDCSHHRTLQISLQCDCNKLVYHTCAFPMLRSTVGQPVALELESCHRSRPVLRSYTKVQSYYR